MRYLARSAGVVVFALTFALDAGALSFTVGPGAVGGGGAACTLAPSDICSSAGGGANATLVTGAALGLVPGDVIDAISLNTPFPPPPYPAFGAGFPLYFSVAPGALGPGLAGGPDPAAIYLSGGGAAAALAFTSAALGLAVGDDVTGLDLNTVAAGGAIFFSLAPGSPSLAVLPLLGVAGSASDIFMSLGGGAFSLFIGGESLGLCTVRVPACAGADANLDALVVNTDAWAPVGTVPPPFQVGAGLLFSIGPGVAGPGIPVGILPGDVLLSTGGGASVLYAGGGALGLAPGDDLDALAIVPEPSTALLVGAGAAGLAAARRRRRS